MKITFRNTTNKDLPFLKKWLMDPAVLRGYPMMNEREIDDAIRVWMDYVKQDAALTAVIDGKPVGMANLYLQPFEKLKHQCLFSITVDKEMRGKGVGTALMNALMEKAKKDFNIELLHLEVYEENPARRLYERLGFVEYGKHERFLKEGGEYLTKIFMQKKL